MPCFWGPALQGVCCLLLVLVWASGCRLNGDWLPDGRARVDLSRVVDAARKQAQRDRGNEAQNRGGSQVVGLTNRNVQEVVTEAVLSQHR
jgi:hypothetical protein